MALGLKKGISLGGELEGGGLGFRVKFRVYGSQIKGPY